MALDYIIDMVVLSLKTGRIRREAQSHKFRITEAFTSESRRKKKN